MKKVFSTYLLLFSLISLNAQTTLPTKKIDTVKTEVIEVITKYNPEIADANKIRKKPVLKILESSKKKKLKYTIFSAPVASTFIPKSGVVKGIDVGVKERIYNNYLALGFGNYNTPYVEAYIHNQTRFDSEFGLSAKYLSSFENVENTLLNSTFSNFAANIFYKKEERYFDWKIKLESERNEYNWYGLEANSFNNITISNINEYQNYNYFKLLGEIDFLDAYLDKADLSVSYFIDASESKELLLNLNTTLDIPIDFISNRLNNLKVNTDFEFLSGNFKNNYASQNEINYSLFSIRLNPEYNTVLNDYSLKLGLKTAGSFDIENKVNQILLYPDIKIQKSIIKDYLNIYSGVNGDLHTNTYKNFTENNPFVSPTLFITQTSEKYNTFLGFNGKLNHDISFNISGSYKEEEDKPLFVSNNSKSNGTSNSYNGNALNGYEYGNSFNVVYDDIKTISFFGEIEYDLTKQIVLGANIQFDNFTTKNQEEAWNLPSLQTSIIGKFKSNKWFATTNIFYVSERKDLNFSNTYPSTNYTILNLPSFIDINVNGGYHFNDKFSAFLKLNNLLNNQYERFSNFNVQGLQVLGGISYKFDF